jgi:hypothetical protein
MKLWAAIGVIVCAALLSGFTFRGHTGASLTAIYVQSGIHGNGASPSSTTIATTLTNPVGVGNAVVVSVGWGSVIGAGDFVSNVSDDKGNTYTIVDSLPTSINTGYTFVSAYALNVTNRPTTITATLNTTRTFGTIVVDEFTGLPPAVVLDNHSINAQSPLAAGTNAISSGAATIGAGDFIYGSSVNVSGNGSESVSAGFLPGQHTSGAFITEYKNAGVGGSTAATFSSTQSSDWITYMMAFKIGIAPPTIASVGPTTASYTSGIASGATIAAVSVTMSPVSPTFGGTLTLTGTSNFALSSSSLPSNLVATGTTPTCTSSTAQAPFNIVATQAGATGSPLTQAVTVTCNPASALTATSLFKGTDTPASIDGGDATAGVYGVQFTPQTSGNATGCKFYKATTNTGTHVCTLWSSAGTQLATVTFSGETASGWQGQNFSSAVALTAGTQYVIGVWDPVGHYSDNNPFFSSQYVSDVDGQLIAPATGSTTNGKGNGVYSQATSTTFPASTFNSSNYWADVVFQYTPVPQAIGTATLSGTQSIPNNAASGYPVGTVTVPMSPTTPVFSGTLSLSQTQGGCNSTNGAGNGSFAFNADGKTLQTNAANIASGTYAVCVLATQASATNNPKGQPFTITSAPQTISAVGLSTAFFLAGTAGPVGTASATMTPATPAFSGTWSLQTTGSVAGTTCDNSGFFSLSGSTLNVTASATTTTYHVCLVATQSGATGSPFPAVVNLTGTAGGNIAFTPLHTYFMASATASPAGNDSNNGTSAATPWLTPNHSVVCGDVIIAAAGAYTTEFIHSGTHSTANFGTVSNCPSTSGGIDGAGGIWFATIVCAGPNLGACTANNSGAWTFDVASNNWAIEGFVHNGSGGNHSCIGGSCGFVADGAVAKVHHVAFINDIAYNTGIGYSGIDDGANHDVPGVSGFDYWATVGSIAENAQQDTICTTQLGGAGPAAIDTNSGTHWIAYGNFSFSIPNNGCPSDQEAYMVDTWDAHGYQGTTVFLNNVGWSAWRFGLQLLIADWNQIPNLHEYAINNTLFNNNLFNGGAGDFFSGQIHMQQGNSSTAFMITEDNIAYSGNTSCALLVGGNASATPGSFAHVTIGITGHENIAWAPSGTIFCPFNSWPGPAPTPVNITANPGFTNTADLLSNRSGVPNCSAFTNVTACMGWNANASSLTTPSVISDLTPSCANCAGKGYQKPSITCGPLNAPDSTALYPTWLKGIVYLHWNGTSLTENADLVTKPCGM